MEMWESMVEMKRWFASDLLCSRPEAGVMYDNDMRTHCVCIPSQQRPFLCILEVGTVDYPVYLHEDEASWVECAVRCRRRWLFAPVGSQDGLRDL